MSGIGFEDGGDGGKRINRVSCDRTTEAWALSERDLKEGTLWWA